MDEAGGFHTYATSILTLQSLRDEAIRWILSFDSAISQYSGTCVDGSVNIGNFVVPTGTSVSERLSLLKKWLMFFFNISDEDLETFRSLGDSYATSPR